MSLLVGTLFCSWWAFLNLMCRALAHDMSLVSEKPPASEHYLEVLPVLHESWDYRHAPPLRTRLQELISQELRRNKGRGENTFYLVKF